MKNTVEQRYFVYHITMTVILSILVKQVLLDTCDTFVWWWVVVFSRAGLAVILSILVTLVFLGTCDTFYTSVVVGGGVQ